jgi:SAM-dependent methyltransferase
MSNPSNEPTAENWATSRGDKWHTYLEGFEAMLAPVDEPIIAGLALDAPYRIADIGCGGGGTALRILKQAPAGTTVHGFDLSPATIAAAQARVAGKELPIVFEVADVATKRVDEPYDRLTSRFGVMFFDDPLAAFSNLARWLRPRGQFAFAVWGKPAENPWMTTVRSAVTEVIEVETTDPDAPGLFRYADVSKLMGLLETAGFAEARARTWHGPLSIGGGLPPSEAAQFALASFSSFAEQLAQAGDDAFNKAQQVLTRRFSQYLHGGVVSMNAGVHIITGARAI